MGQFLKSLIAGGQCVLYLDFRTGSLKDLSGTGNDAVVGGTTRWIKKGGDRRLELGEGNSLYVPHHASFNVSEMSVASVMSKTSTSPSSGEWFRKGAAAPAYAISWFSNTAILIDAAIGGGSAEVSPLDSIRSLGASAGNAQPPRFYKNCSYRSTNSNPLTLGANSDPLYIGSQVGVFRFFHGTLANFVLINEALSDVDMVRLMRELEAGPTVVRRPRTHFSLPYPAKTPAQYAAGDITFDTDCQVRSGSMVALEGADGGVTSGGPLDTSRDSPFSESVDMREEALVNFGVSQGEPSPNTGSFFVEWWVKPVKTTTSSSLLGYKYSASGGWYATLSASGRCVVYVKSSAGLVSSNNTSDVQTVVGKWHHTGLRADRSTNTLSVFIDGVESDTKDASALGSGGISSGSPLYVGKTTIAYASIPGKLARIRFHNRFVSNAAVRNMYLNGARKLVLDAMVRADGSCPVTLSAATVGDEVANGWEVSQGTANVVDYSDSRYLQPVAATGVCSRQQPSGYGSWWAKWNITSGQPRLTFVNDSVLGSTARAYLQIIAGGTLRLVKNTPGSTVLDTYALSQTGEHEFWITRDYADNCKVWLLMAGVWTLVLEGALTGVGNGGWVELAADSGACRFAGVKHYLGEMTPTEAIQQGILK